MSFKSMTLPWATGLSLKEMKASLFGVSQKLLSKSRELVRFTLGFFGVSDSRSSSIGCLPRNFSLRLRTSSESSACKEKNSSEWSDPRLTGSGDSDKGFALEQVLFRVEAVGFWDFSPLLR